MQALIYVTVVVLSLNVVHLTLQNLLTDVILIYKTP